MFDRLLELISIDDIRKIEKAKILLVGVGGVGGYALESLVRSGFKDILDALSKDISYGDEVLGCNLPSLFDSEDEDGYFKDGVATGSDYKAVADNNRRGLEIASDAFRRDNFSIRCINNI